MIDGSACVAKDAVRAAMSRYGAKLAIDDIDDETAMSQDAKIDGVDVYDFAKDLGEIVWDIPWAHFSDQRGSFYGCQVALVPFWVVWRLVRWPFDVYWIPLPNGGDQRLTVRHLARVFESGVWSDPDGERR